MEIKYNNRALLHAYKKHGVTKNQIENSLASGIEKRIRISNNERVFSQTSFNNQFLKEENLMNSQSGFKSLGGNNNPNRNTLPHKHKKKITQSLSMKKKKNAYNQKGDSDLDPDYDA